MARNTKHERTIKMMDEVVKLLRSGHSVQEVAKKFGLSTWTVYNYLGEAAEKAGVTRDELLAKPRAKDSAPRATSVQRDDKINIESYRKKMDEAMERLTEIRQNMDDVIRVNEEFAREMEEKK